MADKKLSSVNTVSDMNFVYAETESGETVKISKADLASVVAELFNDSICFTLYQKGYARSSIRDYVDLNNERTSGVFFSRIGVSNSPNNNYWWYVEVIQFIRGDNRYILQRVTKNDNPTVAYQRISNENGWSSWVSLT